MRVRERRYGKFSRTLQLPQGVKVIEFASLTCKWAFSADARVAG